MKEHRAWFQRAAPLCGLLIFGLVAGCQQQTPTKPAGSSSGKTVGTDPSAPTSESGHENVEKRPTDKGSAMTPVDAAGLRAAVETLKGRIVLVDYWATYCIPCIAGLPKTAELGRAHAVDGLAVITLCMDDLEDEELAQERLESSGFDSTFVNLISKIGGEEEAMIAFDIEGGSLPHYRIYGRDGKLLKQFVMGDPDQIWDHTDVVKAVVEALESKSP